MVVNSTGTIVNGVLYKTPNISEPLIPLNNDQPDSTTQEQSDDMFVLPNNIDIVEDLGKQAKSDPDSKAKDTLLQPGFVAINAE